MLFVYLSFASVLVVFGICMYSLFNESAAAIKDSVVDQLHQGLLVFNLDGVYLDSNAAAKELFPELALLPPGTDAAAMPFLPFGTSVLRDHESTLLEYTREGGDILRTYTIAISRVRREGRPIGYSVVTHNITPLKNVLSETEIRAYTDPLTGLFNRCYFFERAHYAERVAKRANGPLAIVLFDLDRFAEVNAAYGRAGGDYALKGIASLAKTMLRRTDVLGRHDGEAFCVLLPGTDMNAAAAIAEKIRQAIRTSSLVFDGRTMAVTASFGAAALNHALDGDTVEDVFARADARLRDAKAAGRDRVAAEDHHATASGGKAVQLSRNTKILKARGRSA